MPKLDFNVSVTQEEWNEFSKKAKTHGSRRGYIRKVLTKKFNSGNPCNPCNPAVVRVKKHIDVELEKTVFDRITCHATHLGISKTQLVIDTLFEKK